MRSMAVCNQRAYVASWLTRILAGALLAIAFLFLAGLPFAPRGHAQEQLARPGEAYVTRFSGTLTQNGRTIIDTTGTVGSLVDVRQPGNAARGGHWLDEPQRLPVTAAEVGQVFGIAFDDANPANIYLTATSAFGLHLRAGKAGWMAGMWGADGGSGSVYKLDAANNYKPGIFATIVLRGRANTGAALGNIAYDKWNRQLYVSDLETGMIHRLAISDGRDLGRYDHGVTGRTSFTDATDGASLSLPGVTFDANTKARKSDCPGGDFASTPACWNLADFRRRVWGLGVRADAVTGAVRLYYALWGSQGFGNTAWFRAADDGSFDQGNSLWSVGIAADGSFDTTSVRREFFMPDFFRHPGTADHGPSQPVSDIAFSRSGGQDVMLLAERGGVRNLEDIRKLLEAGADKVSIMTAAVKTRAFVREAAEKFGSQCIVVAIDAKKVAGATNPQWEIFTHGGRRATGIDAVAFAHLVESKGAGEILLTSMDRDGTKDGFDLDLTRTIADAVPVPVIASGGVGTLDHLVEGVTKGHASAVLAASIFHFGEYSIGEAKRHMADAGVAVRLDA